MASTRRRLHLALPLTGLSLLAGVMTVPLGAAAASTTTTAPTVHFVSDLPWTQVSNAWGPVEKDRSNGEAAAGDGRALTVGGQVFAKGLGTNANSEVRVTSPGSCTFRAVVGLDAETGGRGTAAFSVWDGATRLADSGTLSGSATKVLTAAVGAGRVLRLVTGDGGDGPAYDHADWADATLTCTTAPTSTTTPTPAPTPTVAPAPTTAPTPVAAPTVRVMPLGDSITDGFPLGGGCGDTSTYRAEQGSYRIELGRQYPAGRLQFVGSLANGPAVMQGGRAHEGHCGWWLKDQPQRYDLYTHVARWVTDHKPDVVLLQAGTNDLIYSTATAEQIAARLGAVVDRILATRPGTHVLVASLPPMYKSTAAFNALVPGVVGARAAQGKPVHFVDHAQAALSYPVDYQAGDYVHPDSSGYAKLATSWFAVMSRLVPAA